MVALTTFGESEGKQEMREIVKVNVLPIRTGDRVKIKALVVQEISQVQNEDIEIVKEDYPHLQGLWFSDVSKSEETLNIDILMGSDYLWYFQEGDTIKGEPDDHVSVKIKLGWVLSGPLKGKTEVKAVSVNLNIVNRAPYPVVKRLWDLETLRIR